LEARSLLMLGRAQRLHVTCTPHQSSAASDQRYQPQRSLGGCDFGDSDCTANSDDCAVSAAATSATAAPVNCDLRHAFQPFSSSAARAAAMIIIICISGMHATSAQAKANSWVRQ
jgi:hypothetical protein